MRIAFITDIHGNVHALDAVLQDIDARGGVDETWILGDIVAFGPEPVKVLERLDSLENCFCIRGNTDLYVCTAHRPPPSKEEVRNDPALLDTFEEVALSLGWTRGMLTATGWMPFLDDLPLDRTAMLPDGTRLMAVHAEPGREEGPGLHPSRSDAELRASFATEDADLIVVGHTHWPMNIRLDGRHLVNPGAVSNATVPEQRAGYCLLHAEPAGYRIIHRLVGYDTQAALDALVAVRHPGPDFPAAFLRGERVQDWPLPDIDYV